MVFFGENEVAIAIEDIRDGQPQSAVPWLVAFLGEVKAVYLVRHFHSGSQDVGVALLVRPCLTLEHLEHGNLVRA